MPLLRTILLRLVQAVPVLLGVSIVTFALMVATPGDPVRLLAGDRASAETIAAIRDRYGLDDPFLTQYAVYLRNLVQGDLGASLRYRLHMAQAGPLRAAARQQIFPLGSAAEIEPDPLARRAGPHCIRHLLGEPRPRARRHGHGGLHQARPRRRARRDRA